MIRKIFHHLVLLQSLRNHPIINGENILEKGDGETGHIDWVLVEAVFKGGIDPHLQVNDFALKGALGGGVFFNGYHIGNV